MRRDWIRGFLSRRSAPRDALPYIATTLAHAGHDLRRAMESGHPTACELLGVTATGSVYVGRENPIEALAATAAPARATQLILAVLLGAAEDATSRQTWRSPTRDNRSFFTALRDWGYPLSPVEQLVLTDDDATPSDAATPTDSVRSEEDGSPDRADIEIVADDDMTAVGEPPTAV